MLRIAFASSDRESVDQHFGAATGFAIHALDGERSRLVEVAEFAEESMDGNENKLAAKIAALADCDAVYCLAVGGSAVRQLLAHGVQPVRLDAAEPIESILARLRVAVHEGGVPWITKALRRSGGERGAGAERFERIAAEGWQE